MDRLRGKFGTDVISYGAARPEKEEDPCHDNRRGKQQLRATIRRLSAQLPFRYREAADRAIARHLLALPEYRSAGAVFCFVSAGREIDTRPILEQTLADGKMLCVPLCVADGIMELRAIRDLKELFPGAYGILEPPADSPALSRTRSTWLEDRIDPSENIVSPRPTPRWGHLLSTGAAQH